MADDCLNFWNVWTDANTEEEEDDDSAAVLREAHRRQRTPGAAAATASALRHDLPTEPERPLPEFSQSQHKQPGLRCAATTEKAKKERDALHQVCNEICIHEKLGAGVNSETRHRILMVGRTTIKSAVAYTAWEKKMTAAFNLVEREEAYAHNRRMHDALFQEARATYRGKYVSVAHVLSLPMRERLDYVPYARKSDGELMFFTCLDPDMLGDDGYKLDEDAYGTPRGVESEVQGVLSWADDARGTTQSLLETVRSNGWFRKDVGAMPAGWSTGPRPPETAGDAWVDSHGEALRVMKESLNPPAGTLSSVVGDISRMRRAILSRHEALCISQVKQGGVEKLRRDALARRQVEGDAFLAAGGDSQSRLLSVFLEVNFAKLLVDHFDASTASAFLRTLLGAIPEDQRVVNSEVLDLVRGRLPHLYIYETRMPGVSDAANGLFPHAHSPGGDGIIYADTYIHVSIGFVTTRLRDIIRKEREEAEYLPLLSPRAFDIQQATDRRRIVTTPGLTQEIIREERFTALQTSGYDFGYDPDEKIIRTITAERLCRHVPPRRVKNNGWALHEAKLDKDLMRTTVKSGHFFMNLPRVTMELVNAETGELVDSSAPHGGLEPEKYLLQAGEIRLGWHAPSLRCVGYADGFEDKQGNVATLVSVKPTALTSAHNGAKFKIRVTARAMSIKGNKQVVLKTESKPLIFYSCKKARSTTVGRKRKDPEKPTCA